MVSSSQPTVHEAAHTLTICNIYVPPSSVLDEQSLTSLLQQLPPPFILMGDFNAHHLLWGSSKLNLT